MGKYIRSLNPADMPMDPEVSLMAVDPSAMDSEVQKPSTTPTPWRAVPTAFQLPGSQLVRGSHTETSDQEEARLKQQGVDGISKPLYLGKNVDGSYLILAPMQEGEELLRIPLTNDKSTKSMIENTTKQIAQHPRTGQRDISQIMFWRDGEQDQPRLEKAPERSKIFCDNMTLWAVQKYLVLKFLECFDLTSQSEGQAAN